MDPLTGGVFLLNGGNIKREWSNQHLALTLLLAALTCDGSWRIRQPAAFSG
jgi:hypothetical protein